MLRTTLEKTTNPYVRYSATFSCCFITTIFQIRFITRLPKVKIARKLLIRRPLSSIYNRPITAHLFFASSARQLAEATDLILDFPGGGFVAMTPEHHEERLRLWAEKTGKPVLAIDYGKAPECKHPEPLKIDPEL
jgi:acetyl esterase/lipase